MPCLLCARSFIQIQIKLLHYNYSSITPASRVHFSKSSL